MKLSLKLKDGIRKRRKGSRINAKNILIPIKKKVCRTDIGKCYYITYYINPFSKSRKGKIKKGKLVEQYGKTIKLPDEFTKGYYIFFEQKASEKRKGKEILGGQLIGNPLYESGVLNFFKQLLIKNIKENKEIKEQLKEFKNFSQKIKLVKQKGSKRKKDEYGTYNLVSQTGYIEGLDYKISVSRKIYDPKGNEQRIEYSIKISDKKTNNTVIDLTYGGKFILDDEKNISAFILDKLEAKDKNNVFEVIPPEMLIEILSIKSFEVGTSIIDNKLVKKVLSSNLNLEKILNIGFSIDGINLTKKDGKNILVHNIKIKEELNKTLGEFFKSIEKELEKNGIKNKIDKLIKNVLSPLNSSKERFYQSFIEFKNLISKNENSLLDISVEDTILFSYFYYKFFGENQAKDIEKFLFYYQKYNDYTFKKLFNKNNKFIYNNFGKKIIDIIKKNDNVVFSYTIPKLGEKEFGQSYNIIRTDIYLLNKYKNPVWYIESELEKETDLQKAIYQEIWEGYSGIFKPRFFEEFLNIIEKSLSGIYLRKSDITKLKKAKNLKEFIAILKQSKRDIDTLIKAGKITTKGLILMDNERLYNLIEKKFDMFTKGFDEFYNEFTKYISTIVNKYKNSIDKYKQINNLIVSLLGINVKKPFETIGGLTKLFGIFFKKEYQLSMTQKETKTHIILRNLFG